MGVALNEFVRPDIIEDLRYHNWLYWESWNWELYRKGILRENLEYLAAQMSGTH